MVGLLRWREGGALPWRCRVEETQILRLRFLCAQVPRGPRTAEVLARRRLRRGAQRLADRGVGRVLLPPGASASCLPEGMRPADTLALRRGLAAEWAAALLRRGGQGPDGRVLVTAEGLTPAVAAAVTELSLRQRYLMLALPYGGQELADRLRRRYGVSLLLAPTPEQREQAALHLAFSPAKHRGAGIFLPLYKEDVPLPDLLLPPEVEAALPGPETADRLALVSVLWEAGRLRPGQVTLRLGDPPPA